MFANDDPTYNTTYLSYEELEARLTVHADPIDVTRVMDAYEMGRAVHEHQQRNDGTPFYHHATRVAKILMDELGLFDADLLIAALLQDVLERTQRRSRAPYSSSTLARTLPISLIHSRRTLTRPDKTPTVSTLHTLRVCAWPVRMPW